MACSAKNHLKQTIQQFKRKCRLSSDFSRNMLDFSCYENLGPHPPAKEETGNLGSHPQVEPPPRDRCRHAAGRVPRLVWRPERRISMDQEELPRRQKGQEERDFARCPQAVARILPAETHRVQYSIGIGLNYVDNSYRWRMTRADARSRISDTRSRYSVL